MDLDRIADRRPLPSSTTRPFPAVRVSPDTLPSTRRIPRLIVGPPKGSPPAETPAPLVAAEPVSSRFPGLDGLRAVAVLAVVLFHLDPTLLPGGFLGVDLFFVISGFLITSLLTREILATERIRLGRFYWRRARRLLPAALLLIAVVSAACLLLWRDELATLRGSVLSSLGYVTNWWLISDHQSYFVASGRPPMLEHLWSLAIEEQYYIVWSLVLLGVARLLTRRGPLSPVRLSRVLVPLAVVAAGASTAWMAVLAVRSDLPYGGSVSRVYFGSDTHSMGLLLGSAVGVLAATRAGRPRAAATRPAWLIAVGRTGADLLGLLALGYLCYQFRTLSEFSPGLYRGGFLAFDALALFVIGLAVRQRGQLGRLLDLAPLRWLGARSYALYLWHWPVFVVTRPGLDVHGPAWLINVARLVIVVVLADLSYRFVEVPMRRGRRRRPRPERRTRTGRPVPLIVGGLAAITATLTLLVAASPLAHRPSHVAAGQPVVPPAASAGAIKPAGAANPIQTIHPTKPLAGSAKPSHASHAGPSPVRSTPAAHRAPVGRHSACPPVVAAARPSISAFGDSVLLGALPDLGLVSEHLSGDAVEGRQAYDVLNDVIADATQHTLAPIVLIHVGNNGIISPDQLKHTLTLLHDRQRVVLVNDRVPRDWESPNNQTIDAVAHRFGNVRLIDWHALSAGRSDWLYGDGIHLTPDGRAAYTQLVLAALK
jgi:peptidoglycan/LPS O-acetylase OafA/YrhL